MAYIVKITKYVLMSLLFVQNAHASFDLYDIKEVYSNNNGSLQFVELFTEEDGQEFLKRHTIEASSGGATNVFEFPDEGPSPTGFKSLLLATAGFQAACGIRPDFVIPDNFLFLDNGSINFGPDADQVSYAALPTDESMSLTFPGGEAAVNSPENNAGQTCSLSSSTTPPGPVARTNRLQNIATRGRVGTGDNVLIGGLVIGGTEPKTVIIRAKGPSLSEAGVPNTLPDPQMALFSGATLIDSNDDWQMHSNMAMVPENLRPSNVQEAVIVTTLDPGAYTAIVSGVNNEEGIGIVEVFELTDTGETRLQNIATRGFVGTGDDVLIGGFVISGTDAKALVIRAKGPSLTALGVPNALSDPEMNLFSGASVIDSNNNWRDHDRMGDIPLSLQPTDDLESVIYTELQPGAYTVIISGVAGGTGIGIIEVFEVDP